MKSQEYDWKLSDPSKVYNLEKFLGQTSKPKTPNYQLPTIVTYPHENIEYYNSPTKPATPYFTLK